MTTAERVPVAEQAALLACLIGDGAQEQTSPRIAARLRCLAAALSGYAGDWADRLDLDIDAVTTPTDRTLATAMLDTRSRIAVDPADVDSLATLLSPYAARCRVDGTEYGQVVARVIGAALNRLKVASGPTALPAEEAIAQEQQLHELECPADPPIRVPPVLECPCGGVWLVRCSKCAGILQTVSNRRCEHLEDSCTGLVDGWRDVDATTA